MARWDKILSRGNVEDRRAFGPAAIGGFSLVSLALYLLASFLIPEAGLQYEQLNELFPTEQQNNTVVNPEYEGLDSYEEFATIIVGSLDDVWENELPEIYSPARLVLFRGSTESQCGGATSAVGPHYCPLDDTIYLDETFFDELHSRFGGSKGEVAQAYVIAHEVGHYVQDLLGTTDRVRDMQNQNPELSNDLSIAMELQADCFAGIWAHEINNLDVLSPGEIEEAISAAEAVGDDHIQETITGRSNPESWTHGSSEQRVNWFMTGYNKGKVDECNTFD